MLVGSAGTTSTAGDDTFDATTAGELNSTDDLDGGAGTDTLDATVGNAQVAPTLANIERLIIQSTDDLADIDLDNADTAITSITVTSSATDLDILNMQNNATFTLVDVTSAAAGLTLDFDTDALGTDEAALVINTDGSTVAIDTVVGGDDDITSITFNATGNDSAITMDLTDITSVTFTGSADLSLLGAGFFTEITSITGTAATGGLTIDLDDNAAAFTINLGAGDDSIVADTANTGTGGRTINMGAGDDTLNLGALAIETDDVFDGGAGSDDRLIYNTAMTPATSVGVTNFEALSTTENQSMTDFTNNNGILSFALTDGIANITNVASGAATLDLTAATGTALLSRLIDGTADSITVVLAGAAATQTLLSIADEETVSIDASDFAFTATNITTTDMTSLTVSGDNAVDVGTSSGTAVATVNVSALDAAFTGVFTASTVAMTVTGNSGANAGIMTITTGSGNDVITGGRVADVITAGAGDDIITGGRGADQITLGTGADTLIFEATGALNGNDVITGFGGGLATAGGDLLDMDAFMTGTVNQHGGTTTAINIFLEADNNDVNVTNQAVLFQGTLNTYHAGGAGALTAADAIAMVVAEIQGAGNAFSITSGGKAVFVVSDTTSQASFALYVDDSVGATAGTIAADDVAVVASLGGFDIDALITTNFNIA